MRKVWERLAIGVNWPVLLAVGVLCAIGVTSIWADSVEDGEKQLLFIGVGLVGMGVFQAVNYIKIGRWSWAFYGVSLMLLLYTIVPVTHGEGFLRVPRRNGAFNWISMGSASLQPVELAKIGVVLAMARYLRFRSSYRNVRGLMGPFVVAMVPLVLILKQPDLGSALIFVPALFVMLFVAGAKIRHLLVVAGIGLVLAPVAWFAGPRGEESGMDRDFAVLRHFPVLVKKYQRDRVLGLFSDDPGLAYARYQQQRALIAFGTGGFSGSGPGNIDIGRKVPESHNDMVFALIGEQFGFIGSMATLVAYVILFVTGIEIAGNTKEPFGRLIAVGIVAMFAGQTFLNLMVCLRLMPVTGVTLPFVSYGGSSLLASFLSVGLLLNVGQNRPLVMAREAFEFD
jgi:cell division protein FtsW (lipid II flippase)